MNTPVQDLEIKVVEARLKVTIEAAQQTVWDALTTNIGEWWPDSFIMGGQPAKMVIEPEVGGRVFEDAGNGGGLCWARIVTLNAPSMLQMAGDTFPGYGGPGRVFTTYQLSEEDGRTTLDFHHAQLGPKSQTSEDSTQQGYEFLFAGCMKAWLEGRDPPEWGGHEGDASA
ncbi:MAG: SRPBCC domain-containing protein [Deltaproteobacteria bacterium]